MNYLVDCVLIAVFWVLVDNTGFIDEIESLISRILYPITKPFKFKLGKPLTCSLCMTFWSVLALLILTGNISIGNIVFALTIAVLTDVINDIYHLIIDSVKKLVFEIRDWLDL